MELLSTIEARESAQRERAWQYERLLDQQTRLRQEIARLEAQAPSAASLEEIQRLVADVPAGLVSRGVRFVPSGLDLRGLLADLVSAGLNDLRARDANRRTALDAARTTLAQVEAALREFA